MTSHHHFHHYHTAAPTPTPNPICHCCSCYPTYTPSPCNHPPLPNPQPHPTPPYTHYPLPPPPPYYYQEVDHQVNKIEPDQQTNHTITSLLRRISALESSLHRRSSPPRSRQSLRDAAARTIQTHFRAFLARRSRTLRQLKQLASIKTNLNIIKCSVNGKSHFDFEAVYHKAMDLLVKLDSIQGDDPLIRDGKRSISNELTRYMKVINGVSVVSSRIVKNVRSGNKARVFSSDRRMEFGTDYNEAIDKYVASVNESEEEEEEEEEHQNPRFSETGKPGVLRNRGGGLARSHDGLKPKQKKSVSFAENQDANNASMGSVNGQESFDAEIELMKNLSRRVEKIGILAKDAEVDEEEDGGRSTGSSDHDDEMMNRNYISRKDGYYERGNLRDDQNENETESFLFSAPMPVKMEARAAADYINRKKGVKIADH